MKREIAIKRIGEKFSIPEEEIIKALRKQGNMEKKSVPKNKTNISPKEGGIVSASPKKTPVSIQVSGNKFLFLEKDYKLLIKKIEKITEEMRRLGQVIGESCDETETFHDNFEYEEGSRQQRMWGGHLHDLVQIKNKSVIITPHRKSNTISIGDKVVIEMKDGEKVEKLIGSYMTFSPNELSYLSPLGKLLIGRKVGAEVVGDINGKPVMFIIKKIN